MIDHRKLGRELELFHTDPLVGAGLPIWLPAGAAARHAVEEYIREAERLAGYQHVYSPPLARPEMYRRSGHLPHFADDMFPPMDLGDGDELMLRPSLCPHHAMVFAARGRSYRDLPLRVAELGGMYRVERSGVLSGLSRVRAIWLNDAHIFCAPEKVGAEVAEVLAMVGRAHAALGIEAAGYRLSLRGRTDVGDVDGGVPAGAGDRGKYAGDPAMWERAEAMLRGVLLACGVPFVEAAGEAAFYGPKIDIQIRDRADRECTLSTVQLDFLQPERFGLSYVDSSGIRRPPVMVHRSVVGGLERLFAHLIEVHEGAFPVWYAPVQVVVVPVGEAQAGAAASVVQRCLAAGLRAQARHAGTVGSRVREAAGQRVPYLALIGSREAAAGAVTLRLRDGRRLDPMPVGEAVALIGRVAAARSLDLLP